MLRLRNFVSSIAYDVSDVFLNNQSIFGLAIILSIISVSGGLTATVASMIVFDIAVISNKLLEGHGVSFCFFLHFIHCFICLHYLRFDGENKRLDLEIAI